MPILGEPFAPFVQNQIATRQQKLGQISYDNDFHLWTTNRKPWIRVCSSINVDESKLKELGLPEAFGSSLLAQNYILYGGVSRLDGHSGFSKNKLKAGLMANLDSTYLNSPNAYGFNSSPEFGFAPLPSVTNLSITPKNNGGHKAAKFKIVCHNVDQFNIIETLYLRLKYSILVEWGHSVYYNNQGELITTPSDTVYRKFLTQTGGIQDRYQEIQQERENSSGNYDGYIGTVTNFNWAFNEHGGYEIEVDLLTQGDIVESYKVNSSYPNASSENNSEKKSTPGIQTVLGKILNEFKNELTPNSKFLNGEDIASSRINTDYNLGINKVVNTETYSDRELIYVEDPIYKSEADPYYYMKLGTLFRLIQDLDYIKDGNGVPLSTFDFDYNKNFCFNPGNYLLSLDPKVCIIPSELQSVNWNWYELGLDTSFLYEEDLGRIMHAYINIDFVLTCLNKNLNTADNVLSLYDFIASILESLNKAFGGFTALKLTYDPDLNQFYVLDENAPPNSKDDYKRFNIIKLKKGNGSFVKKTSIKTQLTSTFANALAISTSQNGTKGDSFALPISKWNKGLTDRTTLEKDPPGTLPSGSNSEDVFKKEHESLTNSLQDFYFKKSLNSNQSTYEKLVQAKSPDKIFSSFIPISLSLEMEGLSGMKLHNKFSIIDKYLPKNYRNNVNFFVKAINHSVNEKEWTTTIDSYIKPIIPPPEVEYSTPSKSKGKGYVPVGEIGDVHSLTSRYPMAKIFYDGPTDKKQIVVHHTAGRQVIANTIKSWSKRTDHVATHYITNNAGEKEQLFADEAYAYHLGVSSAKFKSFGVKYQDLNKTSLAIEMQAWGYLEKRGGKYYSYANAEIPEANVAVPVDKNGNPTSYKGHSYYEKYSDANIQRVKEIMLGWMSKYNIPFVYDYDVLFPAKNPVKVAFEGTPGVYTHNSFRDGKSDVFPQKELIDMFKSIATRIV